MGNTFRVINHGGDIEISIYKKANAVFKTNEYNETEDVCIYKETINIFDLLKENQELKKQLEYFRSNEYLNQLRFERDILQDIANKGEISKEDKDFIDCTHRNTELLEENQKLKKQLENNSKINVANHKYASKCEDKVIVLENQQEEFIKWLEDGIQKVTHTGFFDERIQRAGLIAYNRCLRKYKSIIGDDK